MRMKNLAIAGSSPEASEASTTSALAEFVIRTAYESLPEAVISATKRIILDTIAVTIAAHGTPMADAILKLKLDQGGAPESTLAVVGEKLPAQSAAYVHAQLSNLIDADDTFLNSGHFASSHVWTALAMAEKVGSVGSDVIAAIATGFDISARISYFRGPGPYRNTARAVDLRSRDGSS
jgi:2-methylcitrate dehydratase PrpD